MSLPNNYKMFPNNVEKPYNTTLNGRNYNIFGFKFRGIQDFYDFLKRNPKINSNIWNNQKLESVNNSFDFAGVPYDEAVEKLISQMDPGYQEYLTIQKSMLAKSKMVHKYKSIKTIAGGAVDPVSYTVGNPEIYKASRIIKKPKFISIDVQVAYSCSNSKSQVFNRALILTNLIRALERDGYLVDVNAFMVAEESNEVIKSIFEIKKQGNQTNYQTLYKSLVDVEFFRRLCFRLIEISDVERNWHIGYGITSYEGFVRKLLKLRNEDIYFDQPRIMDIEGWEIGEDFENAIKHLKLEKVVDVEREKEVLRQSIKVLRK